MGYILVLFPFFMDNKCAIYKFWIFEFSIFLFSKLTILDYFDKK